MIQTIKKKLLNLALSYSGIDLRPEPGVWGRVTKQEEDAILAQLYENKEMMALLKIYAESYAKTVLLGGPEQDKSRGMFFVCNMILLKSKKAFNERQKSKFKSV